MLSVPTKQTICDCEAVAKSKEVLDLQQQNTQTKDFDTSVSDSSVSSTTTSAITAVGICNKNTKYVCDRLFPVVYSMQGFEPDSTEVHNLYDMVQVCNRQYFGENFQWLGEEAADNDQMDCFDREGYRFMAEDFFQVWGLTALGPDSESKYDCVSPLDQQISRWLWIYFEKSELWSEMLSVRMWCDVNCYASS